jgi:hypothetical protein
MVKFTDLDKETQKKVFCFVCGEVDYGNGYIISWRHAGYPIIITEDGKAKENDCREFFGDFVRYECLRGDCEWIGHSVEEVIDHALEHLRC